MAGCPRGTDPAQHPEPTARHRCVLLNGPCQQAVTASRALQCVARSGEPRLPPALSRAAHLLRVAFNGINAVSRLLACQLFWQWFSEVLADLHVPQKSEPTAIPHLAFYTTGGTCILAVKHLVCILPSLMHFTGCTVHHSFSPIPVQGLCLDTQSAGGPCPPVSRSLQDRSHVRPSVLRQLFYFPFCSQ